jgi:RES domain-containing protein
MTGMRSRNTEQEYGEEACYTDKAIFAEKFHFRWLEFERSFRTEARLLNKEGRELFEDIFAGIAEHPTRGRSNIIVDAGPGTKLTEVYRARVFRPGSPVEEALTQPDRNLGPPPASHALPGRMNARGISVFYGATVPLVALAEVRPPVGSRVVVARFEILRPLKLLAIHALESVYAKGSLFDPDHLHRVERARFLGRISALMSTPVMPSDDGFDYIVTQAIAEYLANEAQVHLDGLLFPSVQTGDNSLNVVLFYRASRVQPWVPLGKVRADSCMSGPDGPEEDYYVREIAEPGATREPKKLPPWGDRFTPVGQRDGRSVTLAVDIQSLHVHEVKAVRFSTVDHKVAWHIEEPMVRKF